MSNTAPSSAKSMGGVLEENTAIGNGLARTTSETQVSPRVSTVGTDDPSGLKKDQHSFGSQEVGQEFRDYSAPGLDSLHWAGVKKRGDFDQRSVASSMNAERDDKSIYEEPAVGAVEEAEEDDDDDDEEPEEIHLNGIGDPSSRSLDMQESGPMHHDDRYNDQHSPRENRMAESSVAPSDGDAEGSIRPGSDDGEMDEVDITRGPAPSAPISVPDSASRQIPAGSSAAPSSAASPRSLGLPSSPLSHTSGDSQTLAGTSLAGLKGPNLGRPSPAAAPEQYRSSLMRKVTGTGGANSDAADGNADDLDTSASVIASDGTSIAPSLSESTFRSEAGNAASSPRQALSDNGIAVAVTEEENTADMSQVEIPKSTKPATMEALEVEGGPAAGPTPAVTLPPAALAPVDLGPEWEETFKGLLYVDGIDSLGRPVVVVNADAVPPRMKSSALTYVKAHLEPLVNNGHYVIIFTARKAKLPSFWIMGAYQSLPRPFRKNVQYVVLVKPSAFLRAVVAFMRPFVSHKAGRKIKAVETLEEIGAATGGEVTMQHLGETFLQADAAAQEEEEDEGVAAAVGAVAP